MSARTTLILSFFVWALAGCPSSSSTCVGVECGDSGLPPPVGDLDSGVPDAGADAGEPDAGEPDAGEESQPDAGEEVDAGTSVSTCGNPLPLVFSGNGRATVSGSTGGAESNLVDSNCLSSGPEIVYAFTLDEPQALRATVTPLTNEFRPTLLLRGTPCATNREDCAMYSPSGDTQLSASPLAAGTWYLVVDTDGEPGTYFLEVELSDTIPLAGDHCGDPYRTAIGGSAIGSQMSGPGPTSNFSHDNTTTACDGTGPDLVYKLNLTEPRKVTLSLRARTSSPSYRPVLYLQRGTCSHNGATDCAVAPSAGGTATLNFASLPAGTYYIWLDGHSGTSGEYEFSYELKAP